MKAYFKNDKNEPHSDEKLAEMDAIIVSREQVKKFFAHFAYLSSHQTDAIVSKKPSQSLSIGHFNDSPFKALLKILKINCEGKFYHDKGYILSGFATQLDKQKVLDILNCQEKVFFLPKDFVQTIDEKSSAEFEVNQKKVGKFPGSGFNKARDILQKAGIPCTLVAEAPALAVSYLEFDPDQDKKVVSTGYELYKNMTLFSDYQKKKKKEPVPSDFAENTYKSVVTDLKKG